MLAKMNYFGGSYAPAFTDERLDQYAQLGQSLTGQVGEYFGNLLALAKQWWELPESDAAPSGEYHDGQGVVGFVRPLTADLQRAMFDAIPWIDELTGDKETWGQGPYLRAFESLPPGPTRDAAFHLLWLAVELHRDREPMFRRSQ